MRIAGAGRVATTEGDGDGFADDDGTTPAQGIHGGGITDRLVSAKDLGAEFSRKIECLHQVLDSDRKAINGGHRGPVPIAFRCEIGGSPRAFAIDHFPCHDLVLDRVNPLQAALEESTR